MHIYGTLGPACAAADILEQMLCAGMTGVRLNLSHVTLTQAEPQLAALREAAERCGKPVELLIDMQGPELRVGVLDAPLPLAAGARVPLDALALPPQVRAVLTPGQALLLDDGKLLLTVKDADTAEVLRGGTLQSRKSVALPGCEVSLPPLTESDRLNLAAARTFGVTGVMQPFVRSAEDLRAVRAAMDAAGGEDIRLFAKIENQQGLEQLPALIDAADEIVIARGDLGNAMPLWELPGAQKRIAAQCREKGRPFMVVTQMLSSMEISPVPTRAEVSDIFNAVLDGAASVMVTGETAVGRYPVEVIRYLINTVHAAQAYLTAQNS
ncbi:MAG: pyruvate kinase [Oscillospiraceae bacterium]|nr:pyruvate kinase [Oscillospiraceae bacterium]